MGTVQLAQCCRVLKENINFCITSDEVTEKHANKEVLLVCLRFLQNIGAKVIIQERFLDSAHIHGRTTGKNIADYVLNILKKRNINIQNCRRQAYDGARAMSSGDKKDVQLNNKQIQPKAKYTKKFLYSLQKSHSVLSNSSCLQKSVESIKWNLE